MKRFAVAASAAVGLCLLAFTGPAFAYTVPLDASSGFDSEDLPSGKLPASGPFTEDFTFTLGTPTEGQWALSAIIGVTSPLSNWLPTAASFKLYDGTTLVATATEAAGVFSLFAGGLGAGDYTLEYAGTSHKALAWSGSVTVVDPVPELSTWTMMLVGFAGLGFAGYRKARGAAPAA